MGQQNEKIEIITNIEIQNILKDIKNQSKEIRTYFKSLPKDKYNFLLDDLTAYAGGFIEYADTISEYIVKLEQELEEIKYNESLEKSI